MSVTPPQVDDSAGSIRVAQTVLRDLEELSEEDADAASAVRQAIDSIGKVPGEPFRVNLGSESRWKYRAMVPTREAAPVVIYRRDGDGWLVTALISREAFQRQKQAETQVTISSGVGLGAVIGSAIAVGDIIRRGSGGSG